MRAFNVHDVLMELCRATHKFGMVVHLPRFKTAADIEEAEKAIPWLAMNNNPAYLQMWADGTAYFLFDTEEELGEYYWTVVGDDGPTGKNNYSGPMRVYALTCNNYGQLMNENT